jgi:hypothetical protein
VNYLEIINHKLRQLEPEDVVSKIWVVTFTALLAFKRSFTKVQNEEKLLYNLGAEVRGEKPFRGNEALKFFLSFSTP